MQGRPKVFALLLTISARHFIHFSVSESSYTHLFLLLSQVCRVVTASWARQQTDSSPQAFLPAPSGILRPWGTSNPCRIFCLHREASGLDAQTTSTCSFQNKRPASLLQHHYRYSISWHFPVPGHTVKETQVYQVKTIEGGCNQIAPLSDSIFKNVQHNVQSDWMTWLYGGSHAQGKTNGS